MERFELAIVVLLVVLVIVCVYIAASWTFWRKQSKGHVQQWLETGHDEGIQSSISRGFAPEGEEGVPKITITPVQPRPDVGELSALETEDEEDKLAAHEMESQEIELGRLYFALQYDQQRSILRVRLIRGEDIPMERDISATYVGVRLLPLRLQGEQVEPYETSINVSFQECYDFHLTQSELAQQTLDFHICRYDRFSRKVVIGDVFLALAELGAQGIDITREVYLCRNIINSREAKHARKGNLMTESEEEEERKKQETKYKVSRSTNVQENAKALWKVVQSAVHKGRFRGLSYSITGQDSPFYWESMFSSGEGENVEYSLGSRGKPGSVYYFSGPGPPAEASPKEDGPEDEFVEDIVTRGERSGSFLFPSKSDEDDSLQHAVEGEEEREPPLASPLQISPAPEEYYKIVPITPFVPMSPLKDHRPRDSSVSWHVPETFTSRGPDVVQALADSYTDPRIVTTANLRHSKRVRRSPEGTGPISTDSEQGKNLKDPAKEHSQTTKRKHEEIGKRASHRKGRRQITPPKNVKQTATHVASPDGETKTKGKRTQTVSKRKSKLIRTRAKHLRTLSSSSEEEENAKSHFRTQHLRKTPEGSASKDSEEPIVFEARDFDGSLMPILNDRAQSEPIISSRVSRLYQRKREPRGSVSMSDVKDSHIDSSDVSSDFDQ
ncbi:uncharacterized protein LOC116303564 isoform X2 [Actinia tenebrosa]|nr:uncharacterized protein LOC116303564 isoform X2 [Actinia tenebrosa]XP_031568988.1 uncharacterized protein LOC116303564 isoform X2 [Actinia tenebrosa]